MTLGPESDETLSFCRLEQGPSVCIAIPTYGREHMLTRTIEDVFAQETPADEVLVIDQTLEHDPVTIAFLSSHDRAGRLRWLKHEPPNLPGARNRALTETDCEVIVFIDDDVELPVDFLERHRDNYRDPRVVAVAGRVVQPGFRLPARSNWPRVMDHRFLTLDSQVRREGIATFRGCNHSVRVSAITQIGGYDTNYIGWSWGEDADAAIRLWKTGGLIVFAPDAWLKHLAAPTGGCRLSSTPAALAEWTISFPRSHFAFAHLFPHRWFWRYICITNMRYVVFRKFNVMHPWRLPWAVLSYMYSIFRSAIISIKHPHGRSRPT